MKSKNMKRILLIKLGIPLVAAILLAAAVLTVFDIEIDSRGPQSNIFLSTDYENPTEYKNGSYHAVALIEPEALADAYYKYMSVLSHTKVYSPDEDSEITLVFDNEKQTTDFASLMDYYNRENYYFLSSYYIKMADELFHQNAFVYPEQFIKPVYYEYETKSGERRLKALPLAEEGENGLALVAQSQKWTDETEPGLFEIQSATEKELGVWDYGFGSVIQYGEYEKDEYIDCKYDSFQVHMHRHSWHEYDVYENDPETGNPVYVGTAWEEVESCAGTKDVPVSATSTATSLRAAVTALNEPATAEGGSSWLTVNWSPSDAQLELFCDSEHNSHIARRINIDDESTARRTFNNKQLNAAFGNGRNLNDELEADDLYPMKIALIDSVATLSGTVTYTYNTDAYTTYGLTPQASADERDSYSLMIQGTCCGGTMTAKRSGDVITKTPIGSESVDAWGFDYIDSYAAFYHPYVPEQVSRSLDFSSRIDTSTAEGKKTVKLMMELGLLKPYGEDESADSTTEIASLRLTDYELLARVIASQCFENQTDELYFAAMTANRLHSPDFPDTLEGIFASDPETYPSYADGSYKKTQASARDFQAASFALRGRFRMPDNVFYVFSDLSSLSNEYLIFNTIYSQESVHYYACHGVLSATCWATGDSGKLLAESVGELSSFISSFASTSGGAVKTPETEGGNEFARYRSLCNEDDVARIARMVFGEAGGVSSTDSASSLTQQAAVIWTVLNRVDMGYGSISEIVVPSIYNGYNPNLPLSAVGQTIVNLTYDVLCRWYAEQDGYSVSGRVIPKDVIYFYGDGAVNHFYSDYSCMQQIIGASDKNSTIAELQQQGREWSFTMSSPYDDASALTIGNAVGSSSLVLGSGTTVDALQVSSEYPLYVVEAFDVESALQSMQNLASNDESWLRARLSTTFDTVLRGFTAFFDAITSPFYGDNVIGPPVVDMHLPLDQESARLPVYQTIAFTTSTNYSGVISAVDQVIQSGNSMFLFVGVESGIGFGTSGGTLALIPSTGTAVSEFCSPTSSYYRPSATFSVSTPSVTIAAPPDTPVLAVGRGSIFERGSDSIVIKHIAEGKEYKIRYGGLKNIRVSDGATEVLQKQLLGYAGDGGFSMQVIVDGRVMDPLAIFYQPTYGTGVPFADLLGENGDIDNEKVLLLRQQLASANNRSKGVYDKWHLPPINIGITWECAWYAYGRGMQFLESRGYTLSNMPKTLGNGGDYYANSQSLFKCDQSPAPNSWIVWAPNPGSRYGHVAFVEAVAKNGDLLISESGSSYTTPGLRWLKAGSYGSMTSSRYGQYHLAGFVHLDQPLS